MSRRRRSLRRIMGGALALVAAGLFVTACGSGPAAQAEQSSGGPVEAGLHGEPSVLFGVVIEASTGAPVAGATVVAPDGSSVETDAEGRFELTEVAPWTRGVLEASTPGGLRGKNRLRPMAGGRLEVVIYLR